MPLPCCFLLQSELLQRLHCLVQRHSLLRYLRSKPLLNWSSASPNFSYVMLYLLRKFARPSTPSPTCLSLSGVRYSPDSPTPVLPWRSHNSDIPVTKASCRLSIVQEPRLTCCNKHVPREEQVYLKTDVSIDTLPGLCVFDFVEPDVS